jgi:hypothetical protein
MGQPVSVVYLAIRWDLSNGEQIREILEDTNTFGSTWTVVSEDPEVSLVLREFRPGRSAFSWPPVYANAAWVVINPGNPTPFERYNDENYAKRFINVV